MAEAADHDDRNICTCTCAYYMRNRGVYYNTILYWMVI